MNASRYPETRLDECLAAIARQPVPATPPNIRADIWREIRRRATEPVDDLVATLFGFFRRPSLAIAGFAFAIALGTFFGALGATITTSDIYMARQSLHLEVFAPDVSGLPAALAGHR